MAAVLGREFEFEVLLEALDVDEDSLIEALETAEEAQMIQEADRTGDVTFVFVHALVPSAIVESVRTLRRRKLHRRAAEAIEKLSPGDYEALAYHYGEAGNESLALKYYILAGERAAAAFANQDAEEHFSSALDLVEGDREEADLLTDLGRSQSHQSKSLEAIETWGQAIELYDNLNDTDKVAELYARSARAAWNRGDTKGGLDFAREGFTRAEEAPEGPGFALLLAEASRACYFNGFHEESYQYGQRGLEIAERLDLSAIKVEIMTTMGLLSMQTPEDSIKLLEAAARLAESQHMLRQAMRAINNLAIFEMHLYADYAKAIQHMQQAADIAKQVGDREQELFFRSNLGMWMLLQGHLQAAEEIEPQLRALAESIPEGGAGLLAFNQFRSILLASQGNFEQTIDFILERIEEARTSGDLQRQETYLSFILQLSLITGKSEQGKSAAEEMIQLSEIGMASVAEAHSFLSVLYSREGETSKARTQYELASAELEKAKSTYFDRIWIQQAQAELYVAEQKWEDAWRTYEAVYRLAHENKFIWHRNQVRLNWISAYLKHGTPADITKAKELLEEALYDYREMGADGFTKMVEEKLAAIE
jgi:tetratricopeptide (TPR) repeat protein